MHHRQQGDHNMQVGQRWTGPLRVVRSTFPYMDVLALAQGVSVVLSLLLCAGLAVAQGNLRTVVENANAAPVVLAPLPDGPGFRVSNVSQGVVTHVQFGCVAPGTTTAKAAKVRFRMARQPLRLDFSGPDSERIKVDPKVKTIFRLQ